MRVQTIHFQGEGGGGLPVKLMPLFFLFFAVPLCPTNLFTIGVSGSSRYQTGKLMEMGGGALPYLKVIRNVCASNPPLDIFIFVLG